MELSVLILLLGIACVIGVLAYFANRTTKRVRPRRMYETATSRTRQKFGNSTGLTDDYTSPYDSVSSSDSSSDCGDSMDCGCDCGGD